MKRIFGVLLACICILITGCQVDIDSTDNSSLDENLDKTEYDIESGVYTSSKVDVIRNFSDKNENVTSSTDSKKKIYLTFDDGPSANTDKILDILDKYNIKATFFVLGKTGEFASRAYKRIVDEGHSLGMHSFSHKYSEVYATKESFINDVTRLQEYLYEETGVWSRLYRFPGGSSNKVSKVPMNELIEYLNEQGIRYFDWNVSADDAVSGGLSKEKIVSNCLGTIDKYDECVILMHDALDKKSTLAALEEIIIRLNQRGDSEFLPITDDTIPVQHVNKSK